MSATPRPAPAPTTPTPRSHPAVALLLALPVLLVLVGAVGAVLLSPALAVLALLGLLLGVLEATFGRRSRLVEALGGHEISSEDEPRLFNLLDGLCVANGLALPTVRLLNDPAPNALVIESGGGGTLLLCTTGLLDLLDRVELEGVIAHELAAVKRGEVARAARLVVVAGWLCALSALGGRVILRLSEPGRRLLADDVAVGMTRYPPGLRSALAKIDEHVVVPRDLSPFALRATGPNWCAPIVPNDAPARPGELDLELRVAALAER